MVLPIAITVILAVSALLAAMNDTAGAMVLRYVALGCGILWIVNLVCLVLAQSLNSLGEGPPGGDPSEDADWKHLGGKQDETDR
jgi:hypothetical protein